MDDSSDNIPLTNNNTFSAAIKRIKNCKGDIEKKPSLYGSSKKQKRIERLDTKIKDYIDGFTVHGLTRVLRAPRKESIFWFLALLFAFLMCFMIIHGLATKYSKYEVYTEIRSIVTDKNMFPSITFCEFTLLRFKYFSYCGIPIAQMNGVDKSFECDVQEQYIAPDQTKTNGKYWSNGMFNLTLCRKWDSGKCNISQVVKTRPELNHSCFTWNYDGKFHDMYSHVTLNFEFKEPAHWPKGAHPQIIAIPHSSEISEIDLTKAIDLASGKKNSLNMAVTHVRRKKSPFPSKCIDGARELDILPGTYSRRTCMESQIYKEIYTQCGDTIDYMRSHILKAFDKKMVKKTQNFHHMLQCIINKTTDFESLTPVSVCPFPCRELEIATYATQSDLSQKHTKRAHPNTMFYELELQLQNVDSYKVMEEKELYPWDQMACEVGGFLGLVCGASMMSLIEIISCSWFYVIKKYLSRGNNDSDSLLKDTLQTQIIVNHQE